MTEHMIEIRWHGRGGQGAVTSANMLADAGYRAGFQGVMSMPTFGAERRGAPISASTRLSREPLRFFSQVEFPDIVIVLDDSLLHAPATVQGLTTNGFLLVNSAIDPASLDLGSEYRIAVTDANAIAREVGLMISGAPMVNTAMLGSIAKATGIIELEHIETAMAGAFSKAALSRNFEAACKAYEQTVCLFSSEGVK
jgi:pyruvate ferredoxin oxidoreductase gamma subunit